MAEINLTTDDLTILGGPASVNVDLDIGPQGSRGSITFFGSGKPTVVNNFVPSGYSLQAFDSYININPNDDEYLYFYHYSNGLTGLEWTRRFKLIPDTFSGTYERTFTAGQVTINVPIVDIATNYPDILANVTASNFNVQCNILNQEPVSFGLSVAEVALVTINNVDTEVLPITINAIEYDDQTSSWSPITTEKTIHLHITMV